MLRPIVLCLGLFCALSFVLTQSGCDTLITESNTDTVNDPTLGRKCLEGCHSDDNNLITVPKGQWENSAHASPEFIEAIVNLNGETYPTNSADCATCHTSEGYIEFAGEAQTSAQPSTSPIGCYTCHTPHSGDYGTWTLDSLRGQADLVQLEGTSGYQMGKSNMCVNCHRASGGPPQGAGSVTLSGDWGPHFSAQADVVAGLAGARFSVVTVSTPAHTGIDARDGCLSCHYGYPKGVGAGYAFGEHTFRLEDSLGTQFLQTCNVAACHVSAPITDFYDFASQPVIDSLANMIRDILWSRNDLDTSDPSGLSFYADTSVSAMTAKILYNYLLYRMDGSRGVHHPALLLALLSESALRLDSLAPVARFALTDPADTLTCINTPVSFTNRSTGNIVGYTWGFGDGSPANNSIDPTTTFDSTGSFSITLVAHGPVENDTVTIANLVVVEDISAEFTASVATGCDTTSVDFTALSPYATSWSWTFGDGGVSTEQNPTYEYVVSGSYDVTLDVTGLCGSDVLAKPSLITIYVDTAVADFSVDIDTDDVTHDFIFANLSTNFESLLWDFGDASPLSTIENPTHKYDVAGVFTVKLVATNPCGSDSVTTEIVVLP